MRPELDALDNYAIPVVLVTNQSGIARGYYGWDGFHAVQAALSQKLASTGSHLDAVLACACHAEDREPLRALSHPWRKPHPRMIPVAGRPMNLDPSNRGSNRLGAKRTSAPPARAPCDDLSQRAPGAALSPRILVAEIASVASSSTMRSTL